MARRTLIDTHPPLLPTSLSAQRLPSTFGHAVDHRLEHAHV